jgi:ubiquinone/menaquinone biosynthesis C-methylase UbiE
VKRLLDRGHDIRLVLTLHVDAREYEWVAQDAARAGIESRIENRGDMAQDEIEALYDTLDLFVFPSLCESFGFPMVEAMARGLPIAVADTESNREIAAEGAAYFPPDDADALADRLEAFMRDRGAYEAAAGRSIARISAFSWQAAARGTLECLERIARAKAIVPAGRANALESFQARTRLHYDAYPLDFLSVENERLIAGQQPVPFREFVETCMTPGQRVADVGCGPGRATMYLAQKGMDVCAVDISVASLQLARKRAPGAHFVCATNLALPMADRSFDVVVSDGVIHHTPDAARSFRENARLVKARGYMYLGVYRRYRYYYYIYTYLGVPVRWMSRWKWGIWLLNASLLPAYYLVHLVKSKGERTWAGAKNFLYDYIVTPQATFHTYEEVEGWARAAGMRVVGYEENVGNVHAFVLRKD